MSLEANKNLVRTYIETIFNQRQVERTDESPRRDRCADRRGHRAANDLAGVIAATAGTSTLPSLVVAVMPSAAGICWDRIRPARFRRVQGVLVEPGQDR